MKTQEERQSFSEDERAGRLSCVCRGGKRPWKVKAHC